MKLFEDTDRDGKPDRNSVFAEDLYHSMNVAFSPDGKLYLTHRNGVIVLRDENGDGRSESRDVILHMDHGGRIGPDLSTIARSLDREKLMQSILNPSREIAPQFVACTVETGGGQSYTGTLTGQGTEGSVTLLDADGRGIFIPAERIASRRTSTVSLMPEGLEDAMTVQDFRDLLVFLQSLK